MIKNFVTEISNIEVYGVISICLFAAVFTGALGLAFCQKKSFMKKMSDLPLHDGDAPSTKGFSNEQ
jgi:hypothetical protein